MQKLSYGALADLSIGGEGTGVIPDNQLPKLMVRANNALVALYTRFPLQIRTLILEAVDGISTYHLRAEYAQTSGSTQPTKYIKDTVADPFLGDLLQIEHVYDGEHNELPFNVRNDECSIRTTSYDSLELELPKTGDRYHIEYRARHEVFPLVPADLSLLQVRLPAQLEEAFMAHIAGNVYGAINSPQAMAKGQELLARFEAECAFLEDRNAVSQSQVSENSSFERGGWV
jgi:hypothetical protein